MNELTPTTETTETTTPPPAVSIADHAAQFDPQVVKEAEREEPLVTPPTVVRARDPKSGQFSDKPRHRAQSQKAAPTDVPRIAELTKRLREAERERDEWKGKVAPAPVESRPVPAVTPKPTTSAAEFSTPKPTIDSLMAKGVGDPYAELPTALWEWNEAKRNHAETQAKSASAAAAQTQALTERVESFRAKTPDYDDVMAKAQQDTCTPLLWHLLTTDDNGPAIGYYLAQHPSEFDQMLLETWQTPVTPQAVAILQRRLLPRVQAAPTESAAPARPFTSAPRPPNSVRTGAIKTDDAPPERIRSIAEHRQHFAPKR
jgi:hypothetical protein